jgi:ribonuclease HI
LKHQTSQNNHPDKLLLQEITKYTKSKISTLHIRKVKVHINILGNKEGDKLAKKGAQRKTTLITEQYQNAHPSPYWLHKAEPYQHGHPFKDPIKNYQKN